MAYDEQLAERVRTCLGRLGEYREIRMFGGLCFTVNTHMAVGVIGDDLLVAVGTEGTEAALARGARQGVMGQRPMHGLVLLGAAELPTQESLEEWVAPAVARATAKPSKKR